MARVVVTTAIRMVYPFLPVFSRSLGVDLRMLSNALTLRAATGIIGPFLASIGDLRGRKTGILAGTILFTSGFAVIVVWPTFPGFTLSLILTMIGNLIFVPSMQAYLGDWVPYRRRGLVMGLTEFGWSLSFIVGVPLMGLVIARSEWWVPFPILAVVGALFFIVLLVLIPNDRSQSKGKPSLFRNISSVIAYPPALAGILISLLISFSNELVNLIFGVWLEDTFAVKIAALAAASAIIGISELGGESLVSVFVDRLGKRRSVALGLMLNALAALGLPFISQNLTGALVGLFFLYLTFEFTLVSLLPLMTELYPPARTTVLSLNIAGMSLGRMLGAQISPRLYGLALAPNLHLSGLVIVVLCSAALDTLAFIALRTIPKSIDDQTPSVDEQKSPASGGIV